MSFLKETDYSGSRTYDGEPAARALIDHFRLRVALTFAWARLQIEKFLRLGMPPQSSSLVHRGEKHFTMLGTRQRPIPARRRITEIFPLSHSNDHSPGTHNDN